MVFRTDHGSASHRKDDADPAGVAGLRAEELPLRPDAWRHSHLTLILSAEILNEYRRVGEDLAERYDGVDLSPFLRLIVAHAEFVEPEPFSSPACRDPEDDKFLACAAIGRVQAIVSGDKDLLSLSEFRTIPILTPRQFVETRLSS